MDLMEEFRPVIVDSVVLNVLNRGMVSPDDFRSGPEGGVYLKREALHVFFRQYSARLNLRVHHPRVGRRLSYQQWFEVQAQTLRRTIEGQLETYQPMIVR